MFKSSCQKWFTRIEKTSFCAGAFACVTAVVFFPRGRMFWESETFYRWTVALICRMIYTTRHFISLWMYKRAGLCTKQLPACEETPAASWRWPQARSQRVQPTSEQRLCCRSGAPISPGAVWWGSEGSSEFLLTAPNQVIKCWSRAAQSSSILVPFWEKQGQCWFGIMQRAENRSLSKTYFIYSRWQCKSCHSKKSFLQKNLFYSLPSLLHLTT